MMTLWSVTSYLKIKKCFLKSIKFGVEIHGSQTMNLTPCGAYLTVYNLLFNLLAICHPCEDQRSMMDLVLCLPQHVVPASVLHALAAIQALSPADCLLICFSWWTDRRPPGCTFSWTLVVCVRVC